MWPIRRFSLIFIPFTRVSSLPAIAAMATTEVTVKIRIVNDFMIVVPVTINGSGPYDFMLDTGTTNTMLDEKLADELALRREGEKTVLRLRGSMPLLIVHANSLSIAGDTVASKDLFLFTYTKLHGLPPKVRGVLGEGYLRNFDVLIDYRHQVIQLESGLGSMAKTLKGEHLPVQLSGTVRGEPTHGRLIVTGHIRELGDNSMYLVLTPVPTTSPSFGKNWVLAQSGRRSWTPVSDHRASPR